MLLKASYRKRCATSNELDVISKVSTRSRTEKVAWPEKLSKREKQRSDENRLHQTLIDGINILCFSFVDDSNIIISMSIMVNEQASVEMYVKCSIGSVVVTPFLTMATL